GDFYSDNVYAYALSKTLTKVHSPMTVGLYSSCHSRINMILSSTERHMNDEAKKKQEEQDKLRGRWPKVRPATASIGNLLSLITCLLFYRPVWTEDNQSRELVRYVFVRFSAWHITGSDMLWAGLVLQVCKALQDSFGKFQLGLFRTAQHDPEEDAKRKKIEDSIHDWRPKRFCCIPLWALVLVVFIGSLFILVPLIILGFPEKKNEGEEEESTNKSNGYGVLEGFAIATLGVPAAGAVRFTVMLGKNLIFNQDLNIRRCLDNKKVSEQLGLMHEVRKEVRLLSCFIHFMEVFERRKIKVVLEITNLDRCTPEKIVGVLDAINILLSDEESPFISLVAVDPEVLAQKVDQAKSCISAKDRGHALLDRIITLPFTIPPLHSESKCNIFQKIVCGQSEMDGDEANYLCDSKTSIDDTLTNSSLIEGQVTPLITKQSKTETRVNKTYVLDEDEVEKSIKSALNSISSYNHSKLHTYISENTVSMRRVISSIRVAIVLMESFKIEVPPHDRVAAWAVLVDRWPCRLSWALQCAEDEKQTLEIYEGEAEIPVSHEHSKTLWDVYNVHRVEFHVIGDEVEMFLDRDDDPELFEMFLKNDFKFTVGEVATLKLYTVNLDYSIQNEMARIRGRNRLKGSWKTAFNTLLPRTVITMTVDDVCKELSRLKLPQKYSEIVTEQNLNGQTLLLSDPADLRQVMQMTLGEWTAFRIRFLGIRSGVRMNQRT
ncbi:NTPase KAP family P-loop domain-containing protein 1, partial [Brachyhypopomus gauderio]|uniref:NTPase KAP family P-loop domain-containing protein 1 n=1 Tax=Brachyhypopomus gauderio TaxID=698409 RepID=UPI004042DEBD